MDLQNESEVKKLYPPIERVKQENPATTTAQMQNNSITSHSQTGGSAGIKTGIANLVPEPRAMTDEHRKYFKLFIEEARRKGSISSSEVGSIKIGVACISGDPEAHKFAEEIKALLNSVGFNATGISQSAFDQSFTGIRIVIKPNTSDTRYAGMIWNGFGIIRFPAEAVVADYVNNDIEIEVGHRSPEKNNQH